MLFFIVNFFTQGFKVVSFGVSPSIQASKPQSHSLRKIALWYPSLPGPELCLNETSFAGGPPSSTAYLPLLWINFGGPGGCRLQHVSGVSVDVAKGLYGLEFHYDDLNHKLIEPNIQKLGRCKNANALKQVHFDIDGAGGELIEMVEVTLKRYPQGSLNSFFKHGRLSTIKVRWPNLLPQYLFIY